MSHSVKVTVIADQTITLFGQAVNIHDLRVLELDAQGRIVAYVLEEGLTVLVRHARYEEE